MDNSRINLPSLSPNKWAIQPRCSNTIKNIYATINKFSLKQRTILKDNETIMNFQTTKKKKTGNKTDKAKFKVVIRKYLHTHSTHCIDAFFICKDD